MAINEDINTLALDVKKLIDDFVSGRKDYKTVLSEYNGCNEKYAGFKKKDFGKKNPFYLSMLNGHNSVNFTVYTSVFLIKDGKIIFSEFAGPSNFHEVIKTQVEKRFISEFPSLSSTSTVSIGNKGETDVYYLPKKLKEWNTLFATATSSRFFKVDFFEEYMDRAYVSFFDDRKSPYNCLDLYGRVEKYIQENVNKTTKLRANIFYFYNIFKIFNHTGVEVIVGLSEYIMERLGEYFKDADVFAISLNEYVVFEKIRKDMDEDISPMKIMFSFREIVLPYKSRVVYLNGKNVYYFFTDILFSMN